VELPPGIPRGECFCGEKNSDVSRGGAEDAEYEHFEIRISNFYFVLFACLSLGRQVTFVVNPTFLILVAAWPCCKWQ